MAYYQYDIQEGDTPEIIAYKYYNDIYRYWIVMFSNQLLDPQWDWPMSQSVFNNYLAKKYNFNTTATVHHYEKVLTQTNSETLLPESQTIEISFDEYNFLYNESGKTTSYNLQNGDTTSITTQLNAVSYYDYEMRLNESKRSIKLLNAIYVEQLENELKNLLK
jgi:transglutaminase-like putative cysteine protease